MVRLIQMHQQHQPFANLHGGLSVDQNVADAPGAAQRESRLRQRPLHAQKINLGHPGCKRNQGEGVAGLAST